MFGDAAGVEWKKDPEIKDKKSRAGMNLDRSPRHAAPHAEKRSTTLRKPKPLGIMGSPRDGDDGEFLSSSILIYDNEAGSENVRDGLSRSSFFGDGGFRAGNRSVVRQQSLCFCVDSLHAF